MWILQSSTIPSEVDCALCRCKNENNIETNYLKSSIPHANCWTYKELWYSAARHAIQLTKYQLYKISRAHHRSYISERVNKGVEHYHKTHDIYAAFFPFTYNTLPFEMFVRCVKVEFGKYFAFSLIRNKNTCGGSAVMAHTRRILCLCLSRLWRYFGSAESVR